MLMINYLWNQFKIFGVFAAGCFSGVVLCLLGYLFLVVKNFNKSFKIALKKKHISIDDKINSLIKQHQNNFLNQIHHKKDDYILVLFDEACRLTLNIASNYHSSSPFPHLELTLGETLSLVEYLHKRIDGLFKNKVLCIFKKMSLRQIFTLKQKLIDKKYIQKMKKTNKLFNVVSGSLNLINPFHWIKKIFFHHIYNMLFEKIGIAILLILGEEVYQIYSKKIFTSDQNLESYLNELREAINKQNNIDNKDNIDEKR
ncbi:MAG: hypothetical protein Q8899_00380 [Weeping tea tree witches'-broom phytoplasma]|uniref:hypothetical protein n=1 Tax=Candidatus Phytoplasma melaleucae TaxID=2982630 RepID=UPI002939D580|nr:hypothetical protein [Weeping tea tree witches'-broom phytoplasma]